MKTETAKANLEILNRNPKGNLDVKNGKLIQIDKSNYLGRLSKFLRNLNNSVTKKVDSAIFESFDEVRRGVTPDSETAKLLGKVREARPALLKGVQWDFEQKSIIPNQTEKKVNVTAQDLENLFGTPGGFKRIARSDIDAIEIKLNAMGSEVKKNLIHEYLKKNLDHPGKTDDFLNSMVSLKQNKNLFDAFKDQINEINQFSSQGSLIKIQEYMNHPDNQPI